MTSSNSLVPLERIERLIFVIRGVKVMLDSDLAALYGVTAGNLNKSVKRNLERFPEDFMFQLSKEEYASLRFQIGILKRGQHSKYLPHVFTEHGVAMLSSVLNSPRAIQVNIAVMRTFSKLRELLSTHKELAEKLAELERTVTQHDKSILALFEAIRQLMQTPEKPKRPIGFTLEERMATYEFRKRKARRGTR
jgi:phage regulator Rha-like protein